MEAAAPFLLSVCLSLSLLDRVNAWRIGERGRRTDRHGFGGREQSGVGGGVRRMARRLFKHVFTLFLFAELDYFARSFRWKVGEYFEILTVEPLPHSVFALFACVGGHLISNLARGSRRGEASQRGRRRVDDSLRAAAAASWKREQRGEKVTSHSHRSLGRKIGASPPPPPPPSENLSLFTVFHSFFPLFLGGKRADPAYLVGCLDPPLPPPRVIFAFSLFGLPPKKGNERGGRRG